MRVLLGICLVVNPGICLGDTLKISGTFQKFFREYATSSQSIFEDTEKLSRMSLKYPIPMLSKCHTGMLLKTPSGFFSRYCFANSFEMSSENSRARSFRNYS